MFRWRILGFGLTTRLLECENGMEIERTFDDGIHRASFLTKAAVDALCHVDICHRVSNCG